MSELTAMALRLGFLVLLWVFVFAIVNVVRHDLFGPRVVVRPSDHEPAPAPNRPATRRGRRERDRAEAPFTLLVTAGPLQGTAVQLDDSPVLIGRGGDCTLVLDDDYASTRHARIFPENGRWYIEDLGSTNGTFVARRRIDGPVELDPGAPVSIGKTVLELRR